jgi:hypothetical protein
MYKTTTTIVTPLESNGNSNNGEGIRQPKPLKFRFHRTGEISVRVNGKWYHNQELSPAIYLSAPAAVRRRIVKTEFEIGRPLVSGSAVLICQPEERRE